MKNVFQVNAENYTDRHRKKVVWQKILSVLCCIVVFCTTYAMVLPAITLEDSETSGTETPTEDPSGVVLEKLIKYDEATGGFTIRIESYVTGSTQVISKAQPVDIVLVLDASGSMEYSSSVMDIYSPQYSISSNRSYYYLSDGQYKPVYYCNNCNAWYTSSHGGACEGHSVSGTKLVPKTSASDETGVQFYRDESVTYMEALKRAVSEFVTNISAVSNDNRVAIVKFSNGEDRYVNKDVTVTGNTSGYTQVVQGLTTLTPTNVATLKSSVNAISASGDTASDWGMYLANELLVKAKNDATKNGGTYDRQQVVVMFTDGEPNHGGSSDFSTTVANSAIANAKTIKSTGAKVYTIGCFNNANATVYTPGTSGWNNLSNVNKYMNLVSSNFYSASSLNNIGSATYPSNGSSYFKAVSDSDDIISSFEAVSIEIGMSSVQLDKSTELKDYISEQYNLTETANKDVTVHTESYGGKDSTGKLIWVNDNNGPRPQGLTVTIQDDIERDGTSGLVSVTGFDYSEYYVDFNSAPGAAHVGKKLVVDIPIKPNPDMEVSGMVRTNAPGSGLYYGGELVGEEFPFPEVEVPAEINVKLSSEHVADITNNAIGFKVTGATDASAYEEAAKEFGHEVLLSDSTETSFSLGGKSAPVTKKLYSVDHIAKEETPIDVVFDISGVPDGYVLYAKLGTADKVPLVVSGGKAQYKLQPTGKMNLEFILDYRPYTKLTVVNETNGTTATDLKFKYNVSYDDYDGNKVSKDFTLDMNKGTDDLESAITELENIPLNANVTIKESDYEGFTVLFRDPVTSETIGVGDTTTIAMIDNITVIVQNTAGDTLPSTGSSGTLIIMIIGISLMSFAVICGLVLIVRKRVKGGCGSL